MKKSLVLSERSESNGFSLIEVLVFTAVLGLFFVAAMSVTTFNLKNMKIQEHKILATRYAEEGIEWVKQEKEDDWSTFITSDLNSSQLISTTYCLNYAPLDWSHNSACVNYDLGTIYKRQLVINNLGSPVNQVDATVTVSWQDMGTVLSVPIQTVFKLLE